MTFTNFVAHTCLSKNLVNPTVINRDDEMRAMVDNFAIEDLAATAERVWELVDAKFHDRRSTAVVQGMTRIQVKQRVYRARQQHFGGTIIGQVEMPPLSLVQGTPLPFFVFHHSYASSRGVDGSSERLIGWSHPALLNKLKYKSTTLFVDGTFRSVSRPFCQCVVIMTHDRASDLFLPVLFVLCTSKTRAIYANVMRSADQSAGQTIEPEMVICDFEAALMDSVLSHFDGVRVSGCYFHWKQALLKRLVKLRICSAEISVAMDRGALDLLAVMEPSVVQLRGIPHVQGLLQERIERKGHKYSADKWGSFWHYFVRQWIIRVKPDVWSAHGLRRHVVARTNNLLERFNRELNSEFPSPHPTLPAFISAIDTHLPPQSTASGRY